MTVTLTELGIEFDDRDDHDEVLADLRNTYGEEVGETEKSYVFALEGGTELDEWAEKLNMNRDELAAQMHELAEEKVDYDWQSNEPFVISR